MAGKSINQSIYNSFIMLRMACERCRGKGKIVLLDPLYMDEILYGSNLDTPVQTCPSCNGGKIFYKADTWRKI